MAARSLQNVSTRHMFLPLLRRSFQKWIRGNRVIWDEVAAEGLLYGFTPATLRVLRPICAAINEGLRRGRRSIRRLLLTEIIDLGGGNFEAQLADVDENDHVGDGALTTVEVKDHAKFIWLLVDSLISFNAAPVGMDLTEAQMKSYFFYFSEIYKQIDKRHVRIENATHYTLFLSINPLFFSMDDTMFYMMKCYNVHLMVKEYREAMDKDCGIFEEYLTKFAAVKPISNIIGPPPPGPEYKGVINAVRLWWNVIRHGQHQEDSNGYLSYRWHTLLKLTNDLRPMFPDLVPMLWYRMALRYKPNLYKIPANDNIDPIYDREKSYAHYMMEEGPFLMQ